MKIETMYTIDDVRKQIEKKSKPQQIQIVKQAIIDFGLAQSSPTNPGDNQQYQEGYQNGLNVLLKEIQSNNDFKYECDWNWFFNADNIPNQGLVFSTKDFLEEKRESETDSLLMMNILLRQMDEMKGYLDKPIDFIGRLNSLPLNDVEKHILFGLLLKWHGGYPVENLNPKFDTILKLIEKTFLNMFPDDITPEKEFCSIDIKSQKWFREAEAHINSKFSRQLNFNESKYHNKINIDFEDLPEYIIQRGIIWKFEQKSFALESDYLKWQKDLTDFLRTIPQTYLLKTLQKGIEYGNKVFKYHLHEECADPGKCQLNQSWERRLAIAETMLRDIEGAKTGESTDNTANNFEEDDIQNKIPIIKLSRYERLWIQEVYTKTLKGMKFNFRDIWTKLHKQLPNDFHPDRMDERLISVNGEDIRLLGVIALQQDYSFLGKINKVVMCIRDIILTDNQKRNILISELVEKSSLTAEEISLSIRLIRDYGEFYSGAGFDNESTLFKSIDIGGADKIYYEYLRFPGIEKLLVVKAWQFYSQPGEEFTIDEMASMSEKLDSVLKDLETLKAGQEIIWTDMVNELNELKSHFKLTKKNWKQLFAGKLMDMVASGVISETISKEIVDAFKPVVGKLLG